MQLERALIPSGIVGCLCLFPKIEAAMALGGLLLLLQAGLEWKEKTRVAAAVRGRVLDALEICGKQLCSPPYLARF